MSRPDVAPQRKLFSPALAPVSRPVRKWGAALLLSSVWFVLPVRSAMGQTKLDCGITVTRMLGFDAGDRHLVVGGFAGRGNGRIQVWDVKARKMLGKPLSATHAAMSRDGGTLATLCGNGKAGTFLYIRGLRGNGRLKSHRVWVPVNAIHAVALSADGRTAAIAGGNGVLLTSTAIAAAGKPPTKGKNPGGGWIAMPKEADLLRRVFGMEFSPDGGRLMVGGWIGMGGNMRTFVRLTDVNTRQLVPLAAKFAGDGVRRWQFSANGGQVALLQPTSAATLYDTRNGKLIRTFFDDLSNYRMNPVGHRSCLLLLPNGKMIVGTSGVPPKRFQIQLAQRLFPMGGGLVLRVRKWLLGFTPAQPGAMQLLDGRFQRIPRVAAARGVEFLALSPDGTRLVAGSSDKTVITIRSAANPKLEVVKTVRGRDWAVFSRDGRYLATLEPQRAGHPTRVMIYKVGN